MKIFSFNVNFTRSLATDVIKTQILSVQSENINETKKIFLK